jgi:hypothetical protein
MMDRDREHTDLDDLLSKHRLTFNWLNPGMKWYLVGQMKGSNTLVRSEPQPAENIEAAKAAAEQFIRKMYS